MGLGTDNLTTTGQCAVIGVSLTLEYLLKLYKTHRLDAGNMKMNKTESLWSGTSQRVFRGSPEQGLAKIPSEQEEAWGGGRAAGSQEPGRCGAAMVPGEGPHVRLQNGRQHQVEQLAVEFWCAGASGSVRGSWLGNHQPYPERCRQEVSPQGCICLPAVPCSPVLQNSFSHFCPIFSTSSPSLHLICLPHLPSPPLLQQHFHQS